jgi:hypothetical protein
MVWEIWLPSPRPGCTAPHCTALHCTALHCTALHYFAPHCKVSGSGATGIWPGAVQLLPWHLFSALQCTALHCTALHCTALHCTALHCTAVVSGCRAVFKLRGDLVFSQAGILTSIAVQCSAVRPCTSPQFHCSEQSKPRTSSPPLHATLHCTALHCTALHCTALHCTESCTASTLHCINTALQQHCTHATLHCSNTARMQHCTAATLHCKPHCKLHCKLQPVKSVALAIRHHLVVEQELEQLIPHWKISIYSSLTICLHVIK